MNLHSVLSGGYSTDSKLQSNNAEKTGYVRDNELSSSERQIYHNPKTNHVLHNINGTRTLKDLNTDIMLGLGKLKDTQRHKDESNALEKAKKKYNPKSVTVTGSSLGGSLAHSIAKPTDRVVTLNKGFVPFERVKPNETNYRSSKDVVSVFGVGRKRTKNINTGLNGLNILGNHSSNIIKNKGIIV